MDAVLLAILSGFVGAIGERLLRVPLEVRLHNRQLRERNDSLARWVADEDVRLTRQLRGITNSMAARGQLYAGAHGNARASAKELALHRWRDERELAEREAGAIRDAETIAHRLARRFSARFPTLTALDDSDLLRVVAAWEEDEVIPGGPPIKVANPARRSLQARSTTALPASASVTPVRIHESETPNGGRRFVFHLDPAMIDEAGNPDPAFVAEYEWPPFSRDEPPMSISEREAMSDEEFERLLPEFEAYYWDCNRREASWLAESELRKLRGLPAKTYAEHPTPPWRT